MWRRWSRRRRSRRSRSRRSRRRRRRPIGGWNRRGCRYDGRGRRRRGRSDGGHGRRLDRSGDRVGGPRRRRGNRISRLHPVATDGSLICRGPGGVGGTSLGGGLADFLGGTLGLLGVARRSRRPFAGSRSGHVEIDVIKPNRSPEDECKSTACNMTNNKIWRGGHTQPILARPWAVGIEGGRRSRARFLEPYQSWSDWPGLDQSAPEWS